MTLFFKHHRPLLHPFCAGFALKRTISNSESAVQCVLQSFVNMACDDCEVCEACDDWVMMYDVHMGVPFCDRESLILILLQQIANNTIL